MGTRLPIYPYYVGRGRPENRQNPKSTTNQGIRSKFEKLAEYLSHDDVKRCARNVIPIPGETDTLMGPWVRPAVFDPDDKDHSALQALIKKVGNGGTIAIPSFTHIVGRNRVDPPPNSRTRELMRRIYAKRIAIFPMQGTFNGRRFNLYNEYVEPGVVDSDSALFGLIPELASWTIRYLHDYDVGMGPEKKILGHSQFNERVSR